MAEVLLDRAFLDRQTGGDPALASEILGLFADQCRTLMPGLLDEAGAAGARADLAHTLKGSALGVGAARVASDAAAVERALRAGSQPSTAAIAASVEATLAEIGRR